MSTSRTPPRAVQRVYRQAGAAGRIHEAGELAAKRWSSGEWRCRTQRAPRVRPRAGGAHDPSFKKRKSRLRVSARSRPRLGERQSFEGSRRFRLSPSEKSAACFRPRPTEIRRETVFLRAPGVSARHLQESRLRVSARSRPLGERKDTRNMPQVCANARKMHTSFFRFADRSQNHRKGSHLRHNRRSEILSRAALASRTFA